MVERVREFLQTRGGRATAGGLAVLAVIVMAWSVRSNLGETEAESASRDRLFMCAETGKPFRASVGPGVATPVLSPHSGKNTGYEAEYCYWTKDGKLKKDATPVLLNQYAGKKGATFCPDCRRLVTAQNPPGIPGDKAPPTEAEYKPASLER